MKRALASIAGLLLALAGCVTDGGVDGDELTIFAAASLRDAFEAIAAAYREETGVQIILSFDASSALRSQIIEGAPVDLFASADLANAAAVVDAGLADGDARVFAGNALTIVTPEGSDVVDDWTDLSMPGLRIVAAGDEVPITRYATELVNALAQHAGASSGFPHGYAENVVSREDNVRAVLAKVELGEADAAIVYETDAAASPDVRTVAVPDAANVVAAYAFVVLADASPRAASLAEWLLGSEAQAILADHGFRRPNG